MVHIGKKNKSKNTQILAQTEFSKKNILGIMKNLQIKRELNSIEDVTETLSYIRTVVPENMQHIINSQLRV